MLDVNEVRRKYPHPKSVTNPDSRLEDYCVLGAVLKFLFDEEMYGFPCPAVAAAHLQIPEAMALLIAHANDSEDFEKAWTILGGELKRAEAAAEEREEVLV